MAGPFETIPGRRPPDPERCVMGAFRATDRRSMMPRPDRIPWTRYWVTQGETFSTDALGFAQAPFRVRGVRLREHVFEYSDLEHVPFLALMGESGSGKTWEIEALHERARASTLVAALVDLSLVGDIAELRDRLAETVEALGRDQDAIVFFDSFEECPLAGTLGAALVDVMQHLPLERLKVRLSCRSASWTQDLMGRVQRLWRHEDVCAVELLPLTRDDVLLALSRVEPEPERLLQHLERKDSAPLLTSPVTLYEMSFGGPNGMSADEIAEARARRLLTGEPRARKNDMHGPEMMIRGMGSAIQVTESPIPGLLAGQPREERGTWERVRLELVRLLVLTNCVESVDMLSLQVADGELVHVDFRGTRHRYGSEAVVIEIGQAVKF